MTSSSSQVKKTGKKSRTKTKTSSTQSMRTAQKLSKLKLKGEKSKKLSRDSESSLSTKSIEKASPTPSRSSRWQRFHKIQLSTTNAITYNIDEKAKEGMKIEPKLLNWNILGGLQKVYLTNHSDERKAIKIKCSDNYLYRVGRVFTFVEPGEMIDIDIVRQNGGAKPDKMLFLWTKAEKSDEDASKLFNKFSTYPMLVLPLTVNIPTE
ncbi:unnamed protein product [Cercopithifilaria johnstoni]|uniref:Major sperm protein n=1 Tax=Cercopithifilaria johnstoni TaxID=2874296 RepID=A0A8J2PPQ7_9BILA|nr:unnamed protein product [Cercopithifilaria johnstoni]